MKRKIIKANLGAAIPGFEEMTAALGEFDLNYFNRLLAAARRNLKLQKLHKINNSDITSIIGDALGNSGLLFADPKGSESLNQAWDVASNYVNLIPGVGNIISAGMKLKALGDKGLYAMGVGNDGMTGFDRFLNSSWSPTLWKIAGEIGSKTVDPFAQDLKLKEEMGSDYLGSYDLINKASLLLGKEFSTFSMGAYKSAKNTVKKADEQQKAITDIRDNTSWRKIVARNTSQLHDTSYNTALNGGLQLARGYQKGGSLDNKLSKVKGRNYKKVTLKEPTTWEPVIALEIPDKFTQWFNSIPENYRGSSYDYKKAFEVLNQDILQKHVENPEQNHLLSVSPIADEDGRFPFLKLGTIENNPEIQGEFDWYNSEKGNEHRSKYDIQFIGDRYYYVPKQFKDGGKLGKEEESEELKNVIPDGALHKNKHHMEDAEGLTKKGIPVVDNEGELQAEIERDEWIMTLELTKIMEDLYEQFYSEGISLKEKDLIAIDAGKILVEQILYNTDDKANLIERVE